MGLICACVTCDHVVIGFQWNRVSPRNCPCKKPQLKCCFKYFISSILNCELTWINLMLMRYTTCGMEFFSSFIIEKVYYKLVCKVKPQIKAKYANFWMKILIMCTNSGEFVHVSTNIKESKNQVNRNFLNLYSSGCSPTLIIWPLFKLKYHIIF